MLILTRRPGETLIIETPDGERITVTVLDVKGSQVRIGTDAPADMAIVRVELLDRVLKAYIDALKKPAPVVAQDAGSLLDCSYAPS